MPAPALPQQNIYVVNSLDEWPENGDPFILYHQTYDSADPNDSDSGIYFWNPTLQRYEQLATRLWALQRFGSDNLWNWNDSGDTSVDPGAQYMSGNAASSTAVTEFAFSFETLAGFTLRSVLEVIRVGDTLVLTDIDRDVAIVYSVTSLPVDLTTYFTAGVSYVTGSNVNAQQDDIVDVRWIPQSL